MARLVLTILLFMLSLLCIGSAPTIELWYVAILATEFSWIFLAISALSLLWGFRVKRYRSAGSFFGVIAFLLFLVPVAGAYRISTHLDKEMGAAFGARDLHTKPHSDKKPFSFWQMVAGIGESQVPYTTYPYGSCKDGPLTLDFYPSAINGDKPCVIVIHGGSWTSGDSRQLPELNSHLAAIGYHVASINYRLVPGYKSPAPIEDVQAVIKYLKGHAGDLSIDTNNFVLLGRSAGGQIALVAAYTLHDPGIKGIIDFYGPADMVWGYAHPANPLVLHSCKLMEDYLGGTYKQVPVNYTASSATEFVTAGTLPTLILHGQNDPLVAYEHSIRLDKKLPEEGVKHFFLTLPWATHGFDYSLNGPGGQLSTYAIEQFLDRVVHPEKAIKY
jgi:acetyl esterase/lipase